jgi:hypothetical protein
MPEERTLEKVFKNTPEGRRSVRNPRNRWLEVVENDLKETSAKGW